jgi:hypothetical protein
MGEMFIGLSRELSDVAPIPDEGICVMSTGFGTGWLGGPIGGGPCGGCCALLAIVGSSAMERKEEPERRRAASFVERVKAERPWFMCSGNLKSMDTVLASCAIAITA